MANLADLARPSSEAPLGTGLASMARDTISMRRAYNNYVIDASESGAAVLPFKEWVESQSNG